MKKCSPSTARNWTLALRHMHLWTCGVDSALSQKGMKRVRWQSHNFHYDEEYWKNEIQWCVSCIDLYGRSIRSPNAHQVGGRKSLLRMLLYCDLQGISKLGTILEEDFGDSGVFALKKSHFGSQWVKALLLSSWSQFELGLGNPKS